VTSDSNLREHLSTLLSAKWAHVDYDTAVSDIEPEFRGIVPNGAPWSLWQLIEHIRLAQFDILDFCRNPEYKELKWPDEYWPSKSEPPDDAAWNKSIDDYHADLADLKKMVADTSLDLDAKVPIGDGQTYLREFLVVADHTAYHVGEIVVVRRLLGQWTRS
jgi:hypothetical protein